MTREDADADDHVQRVHARQREVQDHEDPDLRGDGRQVLALRHIEEAGGREQRDRRAVRQVMADDLHLVFEVFDDEERQPQHARGDQQGHRLVLLAFLRRMDRQRHGQRRADQHDRVDAAERDVQLLAGGGEAREVPHPVDHVGGKHPAEEHDLRDEEHPHPEGRSLFLLRHRVEVMLLPRRGVRVQLGVRQSRFRQP